MFCHRAYPMFRGGETIAKLRYQAQAINKNRFVSETRAHWYDNSVSGPKKRFRFRFLFQIFFFNLVNFVQQKKSKNIRIPHSLFSKKINKKKKLHGTQQKFLRQTYFVMALVCTALHSISIIPLYKYHIIGPYRGSCVTYNTSICIILCTCNKTSFTHVLY